MYSSRFGYQVDGALVHTSQEVKECRFLVDSIIGLGEWYINIPFEEIPVEFIERITTGYYPKTDVATWLSMIPWLNAQPTIWNSCLVQHRQKIIAFIYGDWDPLLNHMQAIRFSIEPKLFRVDGSFYKDVFNACRVHAKLLGVQRVYFITCRWKAFLRKDPEDLKLIDTKVLEVQNV